MNRRAPEQASELARSRGASRIAFIATSIILVALAIAFAPRFLSEPPSVPDPMAEGMEPPVQRALGNARKNVLENLGSEPAWRRFANLLDAHDLNEEAIVCYEHLLAMNPLDVVSRYHYAIVLEYEGQVDRALAEFQQVATARPEDPALLHRLGELHAREGRHEEAVAEFRRALEFDPEQAISKRGLAIALNELGKSSEAIAILEPLSKEFPADRGTATSLALAYRRARLPEKAARVNESLPEESTLVMTDPLRHQIVIQRVDSTSCLQRAFEMERTGQFQKAIEEFELAAEADPTSAAIPDWIGRNYVRLGLPRLAIPHFDRSVALDPGRVNAYFNRGAAYETSGNRAAAIGDYRRAATLDPEHEKATARLSALGEL